MKPGIILTALILFAAPVSADLADNLPDNRTVELSFNPDSSVYVDDVEVDTSGSQNFFTPTFPYIVSSQPLGIIGLSDVEKIRYENGTPEKFSVTQTGNEFLIPFTQSSYRTVEDEESLILDNTFLTGIEPSFSFFRPEKPLIQVRYNFEHPIAEYKGTVDGIDTITVRNKLNGKNLTEFVIDAN